MKAVEAIVVLLVLGTAFVTAAVASLRAGLRWWRARHSPWEMEEHSDGEGVRVVANRPGDDDLLIGYVPFGAPDFDSKLYELRAEGRQKVYVLNQRERS